MFNSVDIQHFRHGYCHHLATILHEMTGAPILALMHNDHQLAHAAIKVCNGAFDIAGQASLDQVRMYYAMHDAIDPDDLYWVTCESIAEFEELLQGIWSASSMTGFQRDYAGSIAKSLLPKLAHAA